MAAPEEFIEKWQSSGGHERGSGQLFLIELCDLLGLPHPDPPKPETEHNSFVFERTVKRTDPKSGTETSVFIDLYKAGHFVLETKQGVNPKRDKYDPSQSLLEGLGGAGTDLRAVRKASSGHGTRHTTAWDKALEKAYEQARKYIRDRQGQAHPRPGPRHTP